jgi:GNAT superfamily N-acetyltransferase
MLKCIGVIQMYEIKKIDASLREMVNKLLSNNWGSTIMVTRGKVHNLEQLPGFIAMEDGEIKGLITYEMRENECEIISLDSFEEGRGIGSRLLQQVIQEAKLHNCNRVWLITTNDNVNAIRFYQKRGFNMAGLYLNAVNEARKIKPEIPLIGNDNIPILHEIEFELCI